MDEENYTNPFEYFSDPVEFVWNFISKELDEKLDYDDLELFFNLEHDYMKQTKLIIDGVVMVGDECEEELIYYIQKNISETLILSTDEVKQLLWLEQEYYMGVEELKKADELYNLGKIDDERTHYL